MTSVSVGTYPGQPIPRIFLKKQEEFSGMREKRQKSRDTHASGISHIKLAHMLLKYLRHDKICQELVDNSRHFWEKTDIRVADPWQRVKLIVNEEYGSRKLNAP
jgi:hypothetical protein